MFGVDIKSRIEENVIKAIREFENREDISTRFDAPVIGYADTRDPLFDMFFSRGLSAHPKGIYRPGNTVVLHFLPYHAEIIDSNRGGSSPSEAWSKAFTESMWLSMRINGVIRETLDTVGRLSSCTNTPTDWDETVFHEEWSHKLAACAAGMGTLGSAGSFHGKNGALGRLGSIITDGKYAEKYSVLNSRQLEEMYRRIMEACCYRDAQGVSCSAEMTAACPAKAISPAGIDRATCQAYCKSIDEYIPSPDVCGKCFFF